MQQLSESRPLQRPPTPGGLEKVPDPPPKVWNRLRRQKESHENLQSMEDNPPEDQEEHQSSREDHCEL